VELVPDEPAPKPYRVEEHPTPTHEAPPSAFDAAYAELRRLPDDARGVDTAAQRVASAVSQAPKLEAQKMLARLAPTEVLAGLSAAQNSRLEPLRRSVASALRKVALGADDERAIQSLEMLGVWASSRRHGRAARSVLDTLGDEPELMASAPRRNALDRVRKSLETTATD